jgi:hypothetical protein
MMTGPLIWKTQSGKLQQREMNAMEAAELQHKGINVVPTPVLSSKW